MIAMSMIVAVRRVASQFFLVSPRDHFVCPVPSFSEMKENWMKKSGQSARVSEKLVSPGLPGLQVATRLTVMITIFFSASNFEQLLLLWAFFEQLLSK